MNYRMRNNIKICYILYNIYFNSESRCNVYMNHFILPIVKHSSLHKIVVQLNVINRRLIIETVHSYTWAYKFTTIIINELPKSWL